MSEPFPELILLVPEGHSTVPEAFEELQLHVDGWYGATVQLIPSPSDFPCVMPLYAGPWAWHDRMHDDLWPRIRRAFYTLDWMDGVGA